MSELYQLPDGWEWKKLGGLCEFVRGPFGGSLKKDIFKDNGFAVYEQSHAIYNTFESIRYFIDSVKFNEMKRFELKPNSLIMSCSGTIGKAAIVPEYIQKGIINQALLMLNPYTNLYNKYLKLLMDSKFFQSLLLEHSTGAAISNVASVKVLKEIEIPIPSLLEQKRIVQKLDAIFERIDKAIAILQKNIDAADNFMNSVLNDVFSDLEQSYSMESLFKIADVNRGKSKHRPRNDKRLFGGNYPFIQTGDVRNASKYITNYSETYSEFGLSQSKLWQKGTICMTIAANIGDVAILGLDSCFPDSVVGIFSETESNEYLYYYLLTLKKQLESKATTTAQMNINIKVLQDIELPLPSIEIQKLTVKYLDCISDKIEQIKSAQQRKMQNLLDLKSSILDQAFRGMI